MMIGMCLVSSVVDARGRTIVRGPETITKKFREHTNGHGRNPMGKFSGGLSSREQYKIESSLLLRLSRADTPRECVGHRYFPSLVAANDTSAELTTSHDGLPIALQPKRQSVRRSLHTPVSYTHLTLPTNREV